MADDCSFPNVGKAMDRSTSGYRKADELVSTIRMQSVSWITTIASFIKHCETPNG